MQDTCAAFGIASPVWVSLVHLRYKGEVTNGWVYGSYSAGCILRTALRAHWQLAWNLVSVTGCDCTNDVVI